jgi:deoxyribodipyrimidine photolyase-related protein
MADKTLRLILGDQLNSNHSWFEKTDDSTTYVMMEIRTETDYSTHHIQKIAGFFAAMRQFSHFLKSKKHHCIYLKINDKDNLQSLEANLSFLIERDQYTKIEYQLPDEFRVDLILRNFTSQLAIAFKVYDTEHFFSARGELGNFFEGRKSFLMESFYRAMRKKHHILISGDDPMTGQWNYDQENRKKLPKNHRPPAPLVFNNDVSDIVEAIEQTDIKTMGLIDKTNFIWPINRDQSLELLAYFTAECLPLFGSYQDAMVPGGWSLYHSRLSFSLNTKMISPAEVIKAALAAWQKDPERIAYHQLEGFVRQIIGWREYMRGMYWLKMPQYASLNFFNHSAKLPDWYWTGRTKMNCLKEAITQSLTYAYAHHIQRLMITGNFALLAGTDPDEVDKWYLGIYIDALDWVEITNTRGMSQFADAGIVGTKPYVSSAAYIDKMSHYCGTCFYNKAKKTGHKACPFNSLYWNFYDKQEGKLANNPRIGMIYKLWHKMKPEDKTALLQQADYYLKNINSL